MADYVKWRLTRMRAGVTMALFGLLAGLGFRVAEQRSPAVASGDRAANLSLPKGTRVPANSIGTAQVKFHSLLLSDMKVRQVGSYSALQKLVKKEDALGEAFIKMNDELKIDLAGLESKDDAAATFLKKADTAANAAKVNGLGVDQLVQGHGQVLTGQVAAGGTLAPVLTIPAIIVVDTQVPVGTNEAQVQIQNVSGGTLLVNDGSSTTSLNPGDLLPAVQMGDGSVRTLQVLVTATSQAITLNLSSFGGSGGHTVVGQALVGSP